MRHAFIIALLAFGLPTGAAADCFAEYKAKKDNPLRLHYGVMQLDGNSCDGGNQTRAQVAQRLKAAGWALLAVTNVSDQVTDKQKANAGEFFLRF